MTEIVSNELSLARTCNNGEEEKGFCSLFFNDHTSSGWHGGTLFLHEGYWPGGLSWWSWHALPKCSSVLPRYSSFLSMLRLIGVKQQRTTNKFYKQSAAQLAHPFHKIHITPATGILEAIIFLAMVGGFHEQLAQDPRCSGSTQQTATPRLHRDSPLYRQSLASEKNT